MELTPTPDMTGSPVALTLNSKLSSTDSNVNENKSNTQHVNIETPVMTPVDIPQVNGAESHGNHEPLLRKQGD